MFLQFESYDEVLWPRDPIIPSQKFNMLRFAWKLVSIYFLGRWLRILSQFSKKIPIDHFSNKISKIFWKSDLKFVISYPEKDRYQFLCIENRNVDYFGFLWENERTLSKSDDTHRSGSLKNIKWTPILRGLSALLWQFCRKFWERINYLQKVPQFAPLSPTRHKKLHLRELDKTQICWNER